MRIEMIATGEELLDGRVANTNARDIALILGRYGMTLSRVTTVGDDPEELTNIFKSVAKRADVALVTGGLGPTDDDRTAEVLADLAGTSLAFHEEWMEKLEAYFARLKRPMSDSNKKQAYLPEGSTLLDNPAGTAAGFSLMVGECRFFAMPGVPREMKIMLDEQVVPILVEAGGATTTLPLLHTFRCFGLGESQAADYLKDLYPLPPGVDIGYRANMPEVHISLKVFPGETEGEADALFQSLTEKVRERLGAFVFSEDAKQSFIQSVAQLLLDNNMTLAMAESCTGGMVGSFMTEQAGSSAYFLASAVTYSNEAKRDILGVDWDLIMEHGAVSEPVARAMAEGARRIAGASIAGSITGIAGPGGGTPEKPVGTVHIAVATEEGTEHCRLQLTGSRRRVRLLSSYGVLQLVRRVITKNPDLPLTYALRKR